MRADGDTHQAGELFAFVDRTHSGASLLLTVTTPPRVYPFVGQVILCREGVGLTDAHVAPLLVALRRKAAPQEGTFVAAVDGRTQR